MWSNENRTLPRVQNSVKPALRMAKIFLISQHSTININEKITDCDITPPPTKISQILICTKNVIKMSYTNLLQTGKFAVQ